MSQDTRDAGPQAFPSTHWTRLTGGAGSDPEAERAGEDHPRRWRFEALVAELG